MVKRDFSTCPRCGYPTQPAITFNGAESEFWLECTKCNTYINTYIPQEHQVSVHTDPHTFVGNFGGYGSGKTLTSREELYKHIFLTPKGNTLIGANVASQYEQTIKRDIESDLPRAFFRGYSAQKQYYDFINDHRVMYRPFDDPDKLRSYNLSMFVMVEASEVKQESFRQLKSRLRNKAASKPKLDENGNIMYTYTKTGVPIPVAQATWLKGIIESNPDSGWIRTDVLQKSDHIYKHGNNLETYSVLEDESDPAISSHITSSSCNEFLPDNFIANLTKNQPAWWVAKFVYGSFMYTQGLVYPNAMRQVCDTFEVPRHWRRFVAFDYGLSDNAVYLFAAVDEHAGILYVYKEIVTKDKSLEDLAKLYHEGTADIPAGGMVMPPIIDPKSSSKRDYDKISLADHFLDYNIAFVPGQINVDARVMRLNTYIESGKVRIMDCCKYLISELREYKFKVDEAANNMWSDKPVDKNNHAINALEWITMELPADPRNIVRGIYNRNGLREDTQPAQRAQAYSMWALSDPVSQEESFTAFDMTNIF